MTPISLRSVLLPFLATFALVFMLLLAAQA